MVPAVHGVVQNVTRSGRAIQAAQSRWAITLASATVLALTWQVIADPAVEQWIYGVCIFASVGAAVAITAGLRTELRGSEQNAAELMDAFMRARRDLEERDQAHGERLHEARSAASSIQCAVDLLTARSAGRRPDDRKLHHLLAAELARMQLLLDPSACEPVADFDLADTLEPIVLANRIAGMSISCRLEPLHVHGRPRATASVLANLLRNVQVHAPGASVRIQQVVEDGLATVVVDDDGPGIPSEERETVLLPRVRGSAASAPGSGLGLHIAATAMAEQAGTLRVTQPPGRGTRVIFALPVASAQSGRVAPLRRPLAS